MKKIRRKSEREVLTWHGEKEVPYFTFPSFEKLSEIVHGFSSRLGGVSEGCLSSMNLSFSRGDEPERVRENFRRMAESIGFSEENLVFSMQTHTTNVRRVGKEDCGRGLLRPVGYRDVDGLVTNEPEVVLATFYADCVPLFFMDPVRHCIGLSHSGWRGTVGKIGKVTVETMTREFGSDPKDILAAVGPSICQDCYEVSGDVAMEFERAFAGHGHEILIAKENGKYQLDLWKANEIVLLDAGVLPEHIEITDICTCCNPDLLFSHRASHGKRGNLGAFLCLK